MNKKELLHGVDNFHGLSTPDELIETWDSLKFDNDSRKMNVVWDYVSPKQLKSGFNIVNILYDPNDPNRVGHYVLITVNDNTNEVEYFNPVADHTADNLDKLNDLNKYFKLKKKKLNIDLSGTQQEDNEDCGYHCLNHAYNYYNDENNKMIPKALVGGEEYALRHLKGGETGTELEDILKVVRGIYYGLKFGFDQPTQKKKSKGAGLSDGIKNGITKQKYTYNQMKNEIEN